MLLVVDDGEDEGSDLSVLAGTLRSVSATAPSSPGPPYHSGCTASQKQSQEIYTHGPSIFTHMNKVTPQGFTSNPLNYQTISEHLIVK